MRHAASSRGYPRESVHRSLLRASDGSLSAASAYEYRLPDRPQVPVDDRAGLDDGANEVRTGRLSYNLRRVGPLGARQPSQLAGTLGALKAKAERVP